jgi:hypothetical protein
MRTECEQSGPLHWCDRPALMAENDRLRAKVEALRADAGRYRWLRANHENLTDPELDAVIDAAIDKSMKETKE